MVERLGNSGLEVYQGRRSSTRTHKRCLIFTLPEYFQPRLGEHLVGPFASCSGSSVSLLFAVFMTIRQVEHMVSISIPISSA